MSEKEETKNHFEVQAGHRASYFKSGGNLSTGEFYKFKGKNAAVVLNFT